MIKYDKKPTLLKNNTNVNTLKEKQILNIIKMQTLKKI